MARKPHQKRKRRQSAKHDAEVAAELNEVNAILQDDERSQKETWQIGKRLKQLMETHPKMSKRQTVDAFFLWGTALARLAAQNDDATLAHAAADKFHEMHTLSRGDDAAIGAVGYSLWASSLLIMATEQQSREVLDQALEKFQQAVNVDGGTTFETRFQYARALKEGGDMVKFLEAEVAAVAGGEEGTKTEHRQYYERALVLCGELEKIYEEEQSKQKQMAAEDDKTNGGEKKEEEENQSEDDAEEEEADEEEEEEEELLFDGEDDEVDPEDDVVNVADLAEVKLLSAILHGVLEVDATAEQAVANLDRTLALFAEAQALDEENPGVLMELANYVALKGKQRQRNRALDSVEWEKVIDGLNDKVAVALARVEFPMAECKEICFRKDTQQEEEPEDEESTDAQVPHLLHALGKALVAYLIGEASATDASAAAKAPKKATLAELKKMGKIQGTGGGGGGFLSKVNKGKGKLAQMNSKTGKKHPRFQHTVHVLRSAHHFHDKLGCYPLAVLFAHPSYLDEAQCQVWLETAESYGVLDEELQLEDFSAVWDRPWFAKFTQPVEQVDVEQEAQVAKE